MSPPLISKETARYTGAGGKEHCSLCRHFEASRGGRCRRVLGQISPRGWCKLFSQEVHGRIADAAGTAGGGGPALSLDFLTPGTLDPRLVFSRASTGTYFDSAGVMRSAATNILFPSADFTGWVPQSANGPTMPIATANQVAAPDGTMTADRIDFPAVPGASGVCQVMRTPTVTADVYTYSVYLRGAVGGEKVYIYHRSSAYFIPVLCILTTQWQRYSITTGTLVAGLWNFYVGIDLRDTQQAPTSAQTIYAWGAQVELGTVATPYIDTTTTPMGAPRWDYDPATLALRGLLLEDARTNLFLQSEFAASWTATAVTLTANAATSPAGTTTAATLREDGTTAVHLISQSVTKAASALTYQFSLFIKQGAGTRNLKIQIDDAGSNGVAAIVTPTTGAIVQNTTIIGTGWTFTPLVYTALPGGWGRISFNVTTNTLTSIRLLLILANGVTQNYAGDGASNIQLFGAQLELGAFATSYIPTTSVAVTRAQDFMTLAPVVPWYNPAAGTLFAEYSIPQPTPTSRNAALLALDVGASDRNNVIDMWVIPNGGLFQSPRTQVRVAGADVVAPAHGNPSVASIGRLAFGWNGSTASAVFNGSAAVTASGAGLPAGISRLLLGWGNSGVGSLVGHLRRASYYARVLADAEMQALTAGDPPSLDLSFMVPGALDSRISFSRASVGTYTDSTGTIQTAVVNQPRWDYDAATRALRGLLIEEARTNLALQSTDLSNAAWIKSPALPPVVTANQTTAPDGTMSASRVVYPAVSTASTFSIVWQGFTATAAVYTLSFYLKGSVGGERIYINTGLGGTFYSSTRFTLTTAWQRFVFVTPVLTAGTWSIQLGTDLRDVTQTSTPAQTIYVWGAQIEAGAFATSYIATAGSAQTRAADNATMPTTGWINATAGTLMLEAFSPPTTAGNIGLVALDDGTAANDFELRVQLGLPELRAQSWVANALTGASVANGPLAGNVLFRGATAYTTTGAITALNGATPGGNTLTGVASNFSRMVIGNSSRAGVPIGNSIRRVAYWPRTLANHELIAATQIAASRPSPEEPEPPPTIDNELPETPTPRGRRNGR